MRVHILANLRSRGLLRDPDRLAGLREAAARRAVVHETSTVPEVDAVMERILAAGVDLLVLAGGDGTFMSGVTALVRATGGTGLPRVALLPLGTVGTIARNLGEPGTPRALLHAWLERPEDVHAIPRPTLRVRAMTGEAVEERIGFIVGSGLVARFFEVYEDRGADGIPLAGRIVARVFAESFYGGPLAKRILTPIPCELEVDGVRASLDGVSLLTAAVVRDFGLGMKVNYRAGEDPDRFHLVASGLPPARLGPKLPRVLMGRSIGGEGHVDQLTSRFTLRFPVRRPDGACPYVLDGDSFRAQRLEVTAGPLVPIVGPRDA